MFYKIFTVKPETRVGKYGFLPVSPINHIVLSEDDLKPILKMVDPTSVKIYDMDDNYYVIKDGELDLEEDPDADKDKTPPPAVPPAIYTEPALTIDSATGKPVEKPVADNTEAPPPSEHHDEMTTGEKMKLAEDRANQTP